MTHRLAIFTIALSLGASSAAAQSTSADDAMVVTITGLRSARGHVRCALHDSDRSWPSDRTRAAATAVATVRRGRAVCRFDGIEAGRFAVSAYHDEDDDNELDRNVFGAPTEGWGVTRGARGGPFSGPGFDEAVFRYDGRSPVRLRIEY